MIDESLDESDAKHILSVIEQLQMAKVNWTNHNAIRAQPLVVGAFV